MLRISEIQVSDDAAILRLEGEMSGHRVQEARRVMEEFLRANRRMTLDVTELLFADRDGIALLQELSRRQVELINCSPFLAEQLAEQLAEPLKDTPIEGVQR